MSTPPLSSEPPAVRLAEVATPSSPPTTTALRCPACDRTGETLGDVCKTHSLFLVPAAALDKAPSNHLLGELLVGRYIILGILGSGAVGTVYWGIQHPIGRRIAIKVLHQGLTGDREDEERFLREAQAIATLNHPHVVTCYDYGFTENHMAYMAIEYLQGRTLETVLNRAKLDVDQVLYVTRQILEGLGAMHDADLIHRDLKPANMMLCQVGRNSSFLKLIDFGLVRARKDGEKLTQAGHILGTPVYMAPEQALGSADVTAATDVYALGCILYEMVATKPPFDGKNIMDIMLSHVRKEVPPLDGPRAERFPEPFRAFILRCLQKEPSDRFPNGSRALRAFLELDLPAIGSESLEGIDSRFFLPDLGADAPLTQSRPPQTPTVRITVDEAFIRAKRSAALTAATATTDDTPDAGLARQWLDLGLTTVTTVARLVWAAIAAIPIWGWIARQGKAQALQIAHGLKPDSPLAPVLRERVWAHVLFGFSIWATIQLGNAIVRAARATARAAVAAARFLQLHTRTLIEAARKVDRDKVQGFVDRHAFLSVPLGLARVIALALADLARRAAATSATTSRRALDVHDALGRRLVLDIDAAVGNGRGRLPWRRMRGRVARWAGRALLVGNLALALSPFAWLLLTAFVG